MHYEKAGRLEYLLQVLLIALAALSVFMLVSQSLAPQPWHVFGLTVDRLSAVMTVLVSGIGTICYRFALRYLDGEPNQRRFLQWLALSIGSAYLLMLSTNLLMFFFAWTLTSTGLHQLLTFYRDRPEAQRPARKKFLISRLGDVALLAAIVTVWFTWGTFDLPTLYEQVRTANPGPAATAVALLVVTAALTKSAQFPFHTWLPETMEAPTPVSALMHAGIINAGGVLLIRFAPLLVGVPVALLVLSIIGTITAVIGVMAMWMQSDAKRTLAWSTVSQMGFMMVQCGLAAFPVAALHIVGHGCYKAWAFLRTGQLPALPARPKLLAPQQALMLGGVGTLLAVPSLALGSVLTGFDALESPGKLALTALAALAIGQLWVGLFRTPPRTSAALTRRSAIALALTVATSILACVLYHGTALFLAPALGILPVANEPIAWLAALLPVVAFTALVVLYALLPVVRRTRAGRALMIHALHGFYIAVAANRLVDRVWPPTVHSTTPVGESPQLATGGPRNA